MAHPYFVLATVQSEVPSTEFSNDDWNRMGEESDSEIDAMCSPYMTVPFSTVPGLITVASNKRTEGKAFLELRNEKMYELLTKESEKMVQRFLDGKAKTGESDRSPKRFVKTSGVQGTAEGE